MRRRVGSGLLHRSAVRAMERSVVHGGRLVHRRSVTASPEAMNPRMTLPAHRPQEMQNHPGAARVAEYKAWLPTWARVNLPGEIAAAPACAWVMPEMRVVQYCRSGDKHGNTKYGDPGPSDDQLP